MKTIGFATYQTMPDGTADDRLAAEELRRLGFEVAPVVWDDPSVDARGLNAVVIRSCWDYHLKPAQFADWMESLDQAVAGLSASAGFRDQRTPAMRDSAGVRWRETQPTKSRRGEP